ncbi:MAG: thioredoxin [Verrucomicrobiae bacterium]|nr:thioredoxin [Verrucomicrobiae bacterium]
MAHLASDSRGLIVTCPSCGQGNRLAFASLAAQIRCGRCKTELPSPGGVIEPDTAEVFAALIGQAALPVFVDFWAPWCGPCRMVAPEVERLAERAAGEAIVAKVNTEALPEVARRFGIQSIPTFAVFRGGSEVARTSGAIPAPRLHEFLRQASH